MITAKEVRERYKARKAEEAKRAGKKKEAEKLLDAKADNKPVESNEKIPLALRAKTGAKKKK
jgi:hypothetical protein